MSALAAITNIISAPVRWQRAHQLWLVCGIVGLFTLCNLVTSVAMAHRISAEVEMDANLDTINRFEDDTKNKTVFLASNIGLAVVVLFIFLPVYGATRRRLDVLKEEREQLVAMNDILHHQTTHDGLTGLPNRQALSNRLAELMGEKSPDELTVLFVGLDNFKAINDTAGHKVGDSILIAIARRLNSYVNDDDVAARVGGDEFVLVATELSDDFAKRLMTAFAEPIHVASRDFHISGSIGYVQPQTAKDDPAEIIANAGIALQVAKNAGGHRISSYSLEMREAAKTLQQLQIDLRDAIDSGELEPWFQPQIDLRDGRLCGAEVLARWRHPKRGLLTPDKFLPAAEQAGLMIDMDHAIWRAATDRANAWQKSGIWKPRISLNAAPETISDPHLVEKFLLQLQRTELDVSQVMIEVLETTLINGSDDLAAINIDTLAECGISLELDDFGTGYASLSQLSKLPLTGIKLDRSLIAPLPDPGADSIVRAIIALAGELGLHVLAEGVEDATQAQHLHDRGCALAQGYGFGRPMSADDFETWLRAHAGQMLYDVGQHPDHAIRA